MMAAVKRYGSPQESTIDELNISLGIFRNHLKLIDDLLVNFNADKFYNGEPLERLNCLNSAAEYIQSGKEMKTRFMRLSRIGGNCRCEKWDCRNPDCYRLEYQLTDQMIIGSVLTVLNMAIANPSLIENNGEISIYSPTVDVIRKQNEISQMLDSAQVDFDRIKSEIFKLAEMKYDCCTYNENPQKTAKNQGFI